jgi:hypothetical protein
LGARDPLRGAAILPRRSTRDPLDGIRGEILSKCRFRVLVLAAFLCLVLGVVVDIAGESSLPELLQAYQQAEAEREPAPVEWLVFCVLLVLIVADIVATLGLVLFSRWAPKLYLVTSVGILLATPLIGPQVTTAWGATFDYASMLATGAVLALAFWSPVREYFSGSADAV